jgi:hypothetical protein
MGNYFFLGGRNVLSIEAMTTRLGPTISVTWILPNVGEQLIGVEFGQCVVRVDQVTSSV